MWTPEHRRAADRHGLRYPSDLSDDEMVMIEPPPPPMKERGFFRLFMSRAILPSAFRRSPRASQRRRSGSRSFPMFTARC